MFDQIKRFLEQNRVSHAQLQTILTHGSNTRSDIEVLKDTAQKLYSSSHTHSIPKTALMSMADFLQDAFGFEVMRHERRPKGELVFKIELVWQPEAETQSEISEEFMISHAD